MTDLSQPRIIKEKQVLYEKSKLTKLQGAGPQWEKMKASMQIGIRGMAAQN